MSFSETISPLIGRWALAWFYVTAALDAAHGWHALVRQMLLRQVPLSPLLLLIALVLTFMGALSLLFGYQARHGAVMLFGLTVAAALVLHDYWRIGEPALRRSEFEIFVRDVAICGGLLLLVGLGPGPFSIDGRSSGGKKK
jgi:putative oxidoreductase